MSQLATHQQTRFVDQAAWQSHLDQLGITAMRVTSPRTTMTNWRHDPVMAVLAGKLAAKRSDCAPLAGKSTLTRLELSRPEATRYHKISHDPAAIETLFVDLFLEAHAKAPAQIILDLDSTDDPLHR